MKGLMKKDLRLIFSNRKSGLMIMLLGIMFCFLNGGETAMGYMGCLGTLLALGTLSYDEFDHGYSFLFTLPFSRKEYVLEKYLFSVLMSAGGIILGLVLSFIPELFGKETNNLAEIFLSAVIVLGVWIIMACFMIPIRIKFGSEQGKIISGLVIGIFMAGFFLIMRINKERIQMISDAFERLEPAMLAILAVSMMLMLILCSAAVSLHIIRIKEF